MPAALEHFSPPVREWFERAFGEPTPPQVEGWPPIARGESTLIAAPTGSGKTLAAFLWAIDRPDPGEAATEDEDRTRVIYVSPLKALGYDIERNLRVPLAAIAGAEEITGRHPHGRHAAEGARGAAAPPAGHPDHDTRSRCT